MTKDDIIRMAREVGYTSYDSQDERLQQLAALVAAHERESCAELVESFDACAPKHITKAIRARGNK